MAFSIPKGLGSMSDLMKRFTEAKKSWEQWRSLHQEAYDFSAPQRETFRVHSPGSRKNRHIYDSTATQGLQQFSSRIEGSLVPAWQQWFELAPGEELPDEKKEPLKVELEQDSKVVAAHINHSNFSTEITPSFIDLGIGTGALLVEESDFKQAATGSAFKFTNIPLAELYPEKPPRGAIESAWRQFKIAPMHIKRIWPQAQLSSDMKKQIETNPTKEINILIGYLFNPEDDFHYQLVIDEKSKSLMFVQNFNTQRLIIFRWGLVPGEVFGRGPIIQMLSDIRTANKVKEFILNNAALQISGTYTAVDDGVFNPYTAKIAPGSILPVSSNSTQNPSIRALEASGNIQLGDIVLRELQDGIKKALFVSPIGEVNDPIRTATEIMVRQQEMLKTSGAQIGRLKTELIDRLLAACVDILSGLGIIKPKRVDGRAITIRQNSPLSKSQGFEEFQNSQVWFQSVSALPQEVLIASVRVEELPAAWAEMLGISEKLVRTEAERQQIGEAFQQQQLAQAEMEAQAEGGGQGGGGGGANGQAA